MRQIFGKTAVAAMIFGVVLGSHSHYAFGVSPTFEEIQNVHEQEADQIQYIMDTASEQVSSDAEAEKKAQEEQKKKEEEARRHDMDVLVTAYDLSEQSCSRSVNSPNYGVTATGKHLAGQTLESARCIAVDPRVIPLGSKVRLHFKNKKYQHLDGVYTAADTGGAIRGSHIDLFFGDTGSRTNPAAIEFGRQEAELTIL